MIAIPRLKLMIYAHRHQIRWGIIILLVLCAISFKWSMSGTIAAQSALTKSLQHQQNLLRSKRQTFSAFYRANTNNTITVQQLPAEATAYQLIEETINTTHPRLKLISLKTQSTWKLSQLFAHQIAERAQAKALTFTMMLTGPYTGAYHLIERLQQLPFPIFWQSFNFAIDHYPNGQIVIQFTLLTTTRGTQK